MAENRETLQRKSGMASAANAEKQASKTRGNISAAAAGSAIITSSCDSQERHAVALLAIG